MGESLFSHMCAEVGLIANFSKIDKTGWDFYLEFPIETDLSPSKIHKSPLECKVQVKSTDKKNRKIQIKLSNLRKMATTQLPVFFFFLEYDAKNSAQDGYLVHVDHSLITKILKKIHSLENSEKENKFNKRKMTISYDESHLIRTLDGESLKEKLLSYIGDDIDIYIKAKNKHLKATGYEEGYAEGIFNTIGEENLFKLVDISLGLGGSVDIDDVSLRETRFGVSANSIFPEFDKAKLSMPDMKPSAKGFVVFKEDDLSPSLSFKADLYTSPLSSALPEEYLKLRVKGDFFDLIISPHLNKANYKFILLDDVRQDIRKFRDAIKVLDMLHHSGKTIYLSLNFEDLPEYKLNLSCEYSEDCYPEVVVFEMAVKLLSEFNVTDTVYVTLEDILKVKQKIQLMVGLLAPNLKNVSMKFSLDNQNFNADNKAAFIHVEKVQIDNLLLVAVIVFIGSVTEMSGSQYKIEANETRLEKKMVLERDTFTDQYLVVETIKNIENKYKKDYSVIAGYKSVK